MDTNKLISGLVTLSVAYAKRWTKEQVVPRAFETSIGSTLLSLDKSSKRALDLFINVLLVYFNETVRTDSHLQTLVKELALSAGHSISSKIVNGIKSDLMSRARDEHEKDLLQRLEALDDEHYVSLLNWLYSLSQDESDFRPSSNIELGGQVKSKPATADDSRGTILTNVNDKWEQWLINKRNSDV